MTNLTNGESTNGHAPHDLAPDQIKALLLKKVGEMEVPITISPDKLEVFNKARAGILHMLLVRKNREFRFRALPSPVDESRLPDRDMHEYKLIRRLLAKDIEDYIISADISLVRDNPVKNPYGMTEHSEKDLAPIFEARNKIKQDEVTLRNRPKALSPDKISAIEAEIAQENEKIKTRSAELEPLIAIIEAALADLQQHRFIERKDRHWDSRKAAEILREAGEKDPNYRAYVVTPEGLNLLPELRQATTDLGLKHTKSSDEVSNSLEQYLQGRHRSPRDPSRS